MSYFDDDENDTKQTLYEYDELGSSSAPNEREEQGIVDDDENLDTEEDELNEQKLKNMDIEDDDIEENNEEKDEDEDKNMEEEDDEAYIQEDELKNVDDEIDSQNSEDIYDDDEKENPIKNKTTKSNKINVPEKKTNMKYILDDEEEDDNYEKFNYFQKFDEKMKENYIIQSHPETIILNYNEVLSLTNVIRDKNNIIIDDLHKTIPYLTKYEKTRILGQRAKQISNGSEIYVKIPENIIDSYIIAEIELEQKKIPFIIQRPLPNGACEYWKVKDLENIIY